MTRKRLGFIALFLLLLLAALAGGLLWALTRVPDFYKEAMSRHIDPEVRKVESAGLESRTVQLIVNFKTRSSDWSEEFTQRQVNSWFSEELDGKFSDLLPEGAKEPRIQITDEAVNVGFSYTYKGWSGIVSFQVKPWVSEPNHLALEIRSIKAGLISVPLEAILKEIAQQCELHGWKVAWKQTNGNDVMVIDFGKRGQKKSILHSVSIAKGKLVVTGKGKRSTNRSKRK